jgi:iron complex transport system substrate-binding protein
MKLSRQTYAALLLIGGLTGAVLAASTAGAEITVTDGAGRQLRITDTSRILSIGGDITEILYALGADKRIVAVDTTSQFPSEALKEKQSVGYMRALSAEGVISVNASLIIASDRSGPPEVVKALKATPVPYVEVGEHLDAIGVVKKVRMVARIVGLETAGEELATRLEREFATLAEMRGKIAKPVRALFVLNAAGGRATVGGEGSSADAILKLAGAANAASAVQGFKPLSDEALAELQPEAIVTMRRSGSGTHDADQLLSVRGMSATPAAVANRIITMDGLYLLGFGPRTPQAALDLMQALYPSLPGKRDEPTR